LARYIVERLVRGTLARKRAAAMSTTLPHYPLVDDSTCAVCTRGDEHERFVKIVALG